MGRAMPPFAAPSCCLPAAVIVFALVPLAVQADSISTLQLNAPADRDTPKTLDQVQVRGRALTHYKAEDAAVATRTDTPLALVPQSVQVMERQLIDDQAARQVTDLYRSISGISFFSYAGVTLRGFRQENVMYDGLRGDPYAGFSVPQLFNIERVEVLKGPAGALYGGGAAGGIINYVTRKPSATAERRIELQGGNEHFAAGSFEFTGPLNKAGSMRYRLGFYAEGEEGWRWNADSQSLIGDAALAWDVGETGELTVKFTDIKQNLGGNRLRGVPVNDDGVFLADRRWNHNEPTDFLDMTAKVGLMQYRFLPAADWEVDFSARALRNNERQIYHEPMGLIDRDGDGRAEWMTRQLRNQFRDNDAVTVNGNAVWRVQTGIVAHKVLFGADWYRIDEGFRAQTANSENLRRGAGPVPGIALDNPVYGLKSHHDYGLPGLPWRIEQTRATRYGGYVQDEIQLNERWHVMAGLRWDGFKDHNDINSRHVSGHDLSWRIGSTHVLREGLNVYASIASGFVPQAVGSQNPAAGGPFDPEHSRQWELGMKSLLAGARLTLNTALYRIDRRNIVQSTGEVINGINQLAALGLVRSEGVEVDLLADVTENWVLNLAYAYNDARVLEAGSNGITNSVNGRFANAPRNKLGIWTRYDLPRLNSAIGFGLDYTDDRVSLSGQRVKSYTIYDLSWQTELAPWKFQINVKNLFDKVYAASGFGQRQGHFPGEPRRLYLQLAYTF